VLHWNRVDGSSVEWLRRNPNTFVSLDLSWLEILLRQFDLREARPLCRTKFGWHVREYREHREDRALHVREFEDHLEIHTDWWNPDWSLEAFFLHLLHDTPVPHIGAIVTLAAAALYFML
jgi:hypothetical protein